MNDSTLGASPSSAQQTVEEGEIINKIAARLRDWPLAVGAGFIAERLFEIVRPYLRQPERESSEQRVVMNTALGVILNYRDRMPKHIVQWAESKVDLSDAKIVPDEEEQEGPG